MNKSIIILFFTIAVLLKVQAATAPSSILGNNYQNNLFSENRAADKGAEKADVVNSAAWANKELAGHHLNINPLLFTNRSSCAADSEKPAVTANLLIDSMYPAKMLYRLAQATGNDPKDLTKRGVARFRTASYRLLEKIAQKIFKGELPLLHAQIDDSYFRTRFSNSQLPTQEQYRFIQQQKLNNYISISKNCRLDESCTELDQYLEAIWDAKGNRQKLAQMDQFTTEHFVSAKIALDNSSYPFQVSCHYLKKFSPLMAQISTVGANKKVLDAMALTQRNQNDYITSCDDLDAQSSLEAVAYQIDLVNLESRYWKRVGFDFWHTLKLFYTWSFRHAEEIDPLLYPFENVFRSIALEEAVMIFSADCRGIAPATCDNDFLSAQRIRDFAKLTFSKNALGNDSMHSVPQGAEQEILDHPFVDYNNDILDYGKFPDLSDWAKNFADNLRRGRTYHKKRLLNSIGILDRLISKVPVKTFIENIEEITAEKKKWSWPAATITVPEMKNQLYYLCSEFQVAGNQDLSFLRADIERFAGQIGLDQELKRITDRNLSEYYDYFSQLSKEVISYCQKLEEKNIWRNFEVDRNGFAIWYQELINKEISNDQALAVSNKKPLVEPMLTERRSEFQQIICYSGVDCARRALEAIISLHATQKYLKTFFTQEPSINSPSLQNPYAERTACKIYDPWWKVKKTLFNTFSDLSAAAINLVNPLPIFLAVDYVPQRAISFNTLVKNGKITYDPNMSGSNWFGSVNLDLAKILNLPCTVSVGNHGGAISNDRRYFTGYTFRGCAVNKDGGEITISSPSDIDAHTAQTLQGCASCSINFETISNLVATTLNIPMVSSSYYLIRGITYFFRGFSDPVEIPHRWEVDVNNVYQTYRRYGEVPEKCVSSLIKGGHCLASRCEYTIAKAAGLLFDSQVENIEFSGGQAYVKLNRCREEILVRDYKTLGLYCRENLTRENFMTNSSCQFPPSNKMEEYN